MVDTGRVERVGMGDSALWAVPEHAERWRAIIAAAHGASELQAVA